MNVLLSKFKETFLTDKFIKFCCLGCINVLNHSILSTIFSFVVQRNIAHSVGQYLAISIAYFLSSYIIFKRRASFNRYIRFMISYVPSFVISFLVSFITINTLGLPQFLGSATAAMIGGPLTFIIMKVYAFGRK